MHFCTRCMLGGCCHLNLPCEFSHLLSAMFSGAAARRRKKVGYLDLLLGGTIWRLCKMAALGIERGTSRTRFTYICHFSQLGGWSGATRVRYRCELRLPGGRGQEPGNPKWNLLSPGGRGLESRFLNFCPMNGRTRRHDSST